jgi:hypothetical protein
MSPPTKGRTPNSVLLHLARWQAQAVQGCQQRHPGGQLRFSIIILVNAHWKIESERTKLIPEGPGDSWRH